PIGAVVVFRGALLMAATRRSDLFPFRGGGSVHLPLDSVRRDRRLPRCPYRGTSSAPSRSSSHAEGVTVAGVGSPLVPDQLELGAEPTACCIDADLHPIGSVACVCPDATRGTLVPVGLRAGI